MKLLLWTTLCIFSSSAAFAALPVQVAGVPGWDFKQIADGDPASRILGGAGAVLIQTGSESEVPVNIAIYDLTEKAAVKAGEVRPLEWRKAVFAGLPKAPSVIHEAVIKKEGSIRYLVEYQSDTGTETMLNSILMVTLLNGKVYGFSYENARPIYQKHIAEIRKALRELKVSAGN